MLCTDAKPFCLYNPRKIPHRLLPKVKHQIEAMLEQGVISSVTAPTEWCAGNAPMLKPNGKVQISVDLTELNKAIQWEFHPMPSVDESREARKQQEYSPNWILVDTPGQGVLTA